MGRRSYFLEADGAQFRSDVTANPSSGGGGSIADGNGGGTQLPASTSTLSPDHAQQPPQEPPQQQQQQRQMRYKLGPIHSDAEYGHQPGEINFWLPLTELSPKATLWSESAPQKGDFAPFLPKVGEVVRFHGAVCRHFAATTTQPQPELEPEPQLQPQQPQPSSDGATAQATTAFAGDGDATSSNATETHAAHQAAHQATQVFGMQCDGTARVSIDFRCALVDCFDKGWKLPGVIFRHEMRTCATAAQTSAAAATSRGTAKAASSDSGGAATAGVDTDYVGGGGGGGGAAAAAPLSPAPAVGPALPAIGGGGSGGDMLERNQKEAAMSGLGPPLEDGWIEKWSTSKKKHWWYRKENKEVITTWTRPTKGCMPPHPIVRRADLFSQRMDASMVAMGKVPYVNGVVGHALASTPPNSDRRLMFDLDSTISIKSSRAREFRTYEELKAMRNGLKALAAYYVNVVHAYSRQGGGPFLSFMEKFAALVKGDDAFAAHLVQAKREHELALQARESGKAQTLSDDPVANELAAAVERGYLSDANMRVIVQATGGHLSSEVMSQMVVLRYRRNRFPGSEMRGSLDETSIDSPAFQERPGIKSVVIPKNVVSIKSTSFFQCVNMKTVVFPPRLESIERAAFAGCATLSELTLPETTVQLGTDCFKDCTGLTCVVIEGWRSFAAYSRHFARNVFTVSDSIVTVDAPNSIVQQLGGVCQGVTKFKSLPLHVRGSKGRLNYYFWNENTHGDMCSLSAKRSVMAVMQLAKGLGREGAPIAPLPFLPPEMWEHTLSFIMKSELGQPALK